MPPKSHPRRDQTDDVEHVREGDRQDVRYPRGHGRDGGPHRDDRHDDAAARPVATTAGHAVRTTKKEVTHGAREFGPPSLYCRPRIVFSFIFLYEYFLIHVNIGDMYLIRQGCLFLISSQLGKFVVEVLKED